jgi:hypothetical protein
MIVLDERIYYCIIPLIAKIVLQHCFVCGLSFVVFLVYDPLEFSLEFKVFFFSVMLECSSISEVIVSSKICVASAAFLKDADQLFPCSLSQTCKQNYAPKTLNAATK